MIINNLNNLNVKLSISQLNKLNFAVKNKTEVLLRLSSNMVGNLGDETNFLHKLLLINRQVANVHKVFANKFQLFKMIQSGEFLSRLLVPLLKIGLPLMKSVIKPLAKSVLIPLGLNAEASCRNT